MKKIWKSKWKRAVLILFILAVIIGAVVAVLIITDKGDCVEVATVEKDNVEQYYDTSGVISSSSTTKYNSYVGLVPKTVNVAPGDVVCKGDVLATFDTSAMNEVISEKKQAYEEALKSYNNAVSNKNDKDKQVKEIQSQISTLQSSLDGLDETEDAIEIAEIKLKIKLLSAQETLASTGDTTALIEIYKSQMESAKSAYNAILAEKQSYENGIVATADGKVTDVYIKVGEPYEMVEDTSSSFDISSLLSGDSSSLDVSSILSALSITSEASLEKGVALTVDYYDGYTIGFSLGKYDIQKVKIGMSAIISYTDYEYEGIVSYISATATSTSSIVSSMMGSSTSTSSSVSAEVEITNPDENLVVGFDAKISILIDEKKNVLTIPVEALHIEDGKTYVYVIEDGKAVKKEIEVGASSDTKYEVTKGLVENETIILNASKITEGAKVYAEE